MTLVDDLRGACGATRGLFDAAACSVALVTEAGDELEYVAAHGVGADAITGVRLPLGQGIAGFVALSGQPVGIGDVHRDRRFARDVAVATDYVPISILAVPMLDDEGETTGVLSVLDPNRPTGGAGLDTLAVIASQVALVVRLNHQLQISDRRGGVVGDPQLVAALATLEGAGARARNVARDVLTAIASLQESR